MRHEAWGVGLDAVLALPLCPSHDCRAHGEDCDEQLAQLGSLGGNDGPCFALSFGGNDGPCFALSLGGNDGPCFALSRAIFPAGLLIRAHLLHACIAS